MIGVIKEGKIDPKELTLSKYVCIQTLNVHNFDLLSIASSFEFPFKIIHYA